MLLVVIVALAVALVVEHDRAASREAEVAGSSAWQSIGQNRAYRREIERLRKRVEELEGRSATK
jgi:hypothetical protein